MIRAIIAVLCVRLGGCATLQRRPPCGEFAPVPPPRVVPGLAVGDASPDRATAVLIVSEMCSGRRIPGALVRFVDADTDAPSTGTDSAGRALLRGRAGTRDVRVSAFGFYPDTITLPLRATSRDSVFISLRLARSLLDRVGSGAPPANDACCR